MRFFTLELLPEQIIRVKEPQLIFRKVPPDILVTEMDKNANLPSLL